jgi:energy-converting hydrogenase Eha subunit H
VSSELKSIFFRVALVSTIVAAMPIGFAKTPAQAEKVLRVAFLHLMMVLIWSKPLISIAAMLLM